MTLTEFRYIVAVAAERHFGHAAERCHVSQPTLSVAVKKLEEQLGLILFERSKTEVRITEEGQAIVDQARKILEQVEALKRLANRNSDPLDGVLKVGAIFTIGPYLFPSLVPALRQESPQMRLQIDEDYTENLRQKLRHGDLDAIVIALPFHEPEVETLPLYEESFVLLAPADHEVLKPKSVSFNELKNQRLMMLGPGHCFRDQVLEACPECLDGTPGDSEVVTGSSLETIRQMVAGGMGISVLPETASFQHNDELGLDIRPFRKPQPSRRIAIAWRRGFPRVEAVLHLKGIIQDLNLPGSRLVSV